jgi:HAD superfamily hydrolase (TIGR01509 family)
MRFNEELKNGKPDNVVIGRDIRALIFDCDGTLVDSMPAHMEAWKYAFKLFNSGYEADFLFSLKGMKDTDIVKAYNKSFGTTLDAKALVTAKHEYFIKNIQRIKPIKPVVDIANSYYKKLPLAVVSGSTKQIVYSELKFTGIFDLFDIILTADDPFAPKPDPEIFLAAAAKLNASALQCMVFEDGDAGLEAAMAAGMKTFDVRTILDK